MISKEIVAKKKKKNWKFPKRAKLNIYFNNFCVAAVISNKYLLVTTFVR